MNHFELILKYKILIQRFYIIKSFDLLYEYFRNIITDMTILSKT